MVYRRKFILIRYLDYPKDALLWASKLEEDPKAEFSIVHDRDSWFDVVTIDPSMVAFMDNPDMNVIERAVSRDLSLIDLYKDILSKDFLRQLVLEKPHAMMFVDQTEDLCLEVIDMMIENDYAIGDLSYCIKLFTDKIRIRALMLGGIGRGKIECDEDYKKLVVSRNPNAIVFFDDPSYELQMLAVSYVPSSIVYITKPHRDAIIKAIGCPSVMTKISRHDEDLIYMALKANVESFVFIDNPDDDMIMLALRGDGTHLINVSDKTYERCIAAYGNNISAIRHFPEEYLSEEFVTETLFEMIRIKYGNEALSMLKDGTISCHKFPDNDSKIILPLALIAKYCPKDLAGDIYFFDKGIVGHMNSLGYKAYDKILDNDPYIMDTMHLDNPSDYQLIAEKSLATGNIDLYNIKKELCEDYEKLVMMAAAQYPPVILNVDIDIATRVADVYPRCLAYLPNCPEDILLQERLLRPHFLDDKDGEDVICQVLVAHPHRIYSFKSPTPRMIRTAVNKKID